MSELALFGGPKTIVEPLAPYRSIGREEVDAARAVVESGILSDFVGGWGPEFYGGPRVQELERAWERHFGVRHAITVNSATSALITAVGAIGVEPGDEVIVSPWTMSASATCALVWNAIPVFADIEEATFNLDPACVEKCVTPQTRAIIVSDIFGQAADLDGIMAIAKAHDLKVIEDCAQAPGARYRDRYAGTVADVGVFSLNYHKHVHTGEGGVCVTDDAALAERLQLIRNHAEAVVEGKGVTDLGNMIGFNFRMTEVEAAIGIEQLKKLAPLSAGRIAAAERLSAGLRGLDGLRAPVVRRDCTHVYYVYPLLYDPAATGVERDLVVRALQAEGVPVSAGYVHLPALPMYRQKTAYGRSGFPWTADFYKGHVSYARGVCPVSESLHEARFILLEMCRYVLADDEVDVIVRGFRKVWRNLRVLETSRTKR